MIHLVFHASKSPHPARGHVNGKMYVGDNDMRNAAQVATRHGHVQCLKALVQDCNLPAKALCDADVNGLPTGCISEFSLVNHPMAQILDTRRFTSTKDLLLM